MAKKTLDQVAHEDTLDIVEQINDIWIEAFPMEALDSEDRQINAASGEENPRWNLGLFYQIGGMADQAAYALNKAKDMLDDLDHKVKDEEERNGADSIRAVMLADIRCRQEALWNLALQDFNVMVDRFNFVMGGTCHWGGNAADSDNGRAWYQAERDRRGGGRKGATAPAHRETTGRQKGGHVGQGESLGHQPPPQGGGFSCQQKNRPPAAARPSAGQRACPLSLPTHHPFPPNGRSVWLRLGLAARPPPPK